MVIFRSISMGSALKQIACSSILALLSFLSQVEAQDNPAAKYEVTWDSLGKNEKDSMPLGNGDIGLNLWTEQNGDVVFLIGKTDAWTENDQLVKLGRVRVKLTPNPFVGGTFHQTLKPQMGEVDLEGSGGTLRAWVDANHPVIHLEFEGKDLTALNATVGSWRTVARTIPPNGREISGIGVFREMLGGPNDPRILDPATGASAHPVVVDPDTFLPAKDNSISWCHFNSRSTVYPDVFKTQHLESLLEKYPDPILHRCFGVLMKGPGLTSSDDRTLQTSAPDTHLRLDLYALTEQPVDSAETWRTDMAKTAASVDAVDLESARKAHLQWWSDFWNRSWIDVTGDADAENVTQGYAMQRWMMACGGRGAMAMKYNGSIFTVGREPVEDTPETEKNRIDPDFRAWGGNYWFQNTRHLYWPFIASGDSDLLAPFFTMYRNNLQLAKDRTKLYWNHDGAVWPETYNFWGLPNNNDFCRGNPSNPSNIILNTWVRYHVNGSIELTLMLLDQYAYYQDAGFAQTTVVPIADAVTTYFDQHWKRGGDGKLLLDPDNSLETYQSGTVNPLPDIAGLKCVLPRLLALPTDLTTDAQRAMWTKLLGDLPAVPVGTTDADGKIPAPVTKADPNGKPVLLPAQKYGRPSNSENAELYATFPYRIYTFDKPDLDLAKNTYAAKLFKSSTCWGQDGLVAAVLGLADIARHEATANFTDYGDQRFKWFWKPGHDWIPDYDNGGAGMEMLQLMLMQCDGKKITLLPAWPVGWDADFKLHAPYQTTIEAKVQGGKIVDLKVTPPERKQDIVVAGQAAGI
jgi:alpha-L-fucosidase 2